MRRAIMLALEGEGNVNPNPLVGAVIVKDNLIIGEGCHKMYGFLHAERNALKDCVQKGNSAVGAEIYVTLEPCCHVGKQPPCTQALLEAGIRKVIVGSFDPNPLVSGKGIAFLRKNGIEVEEGFLKDECDELNSIFFHYIKTGKPYVSLKYAMTADGKIATAAGFSKWITCEKSRKYVQRLRKRYSCILAGIGTVLKDNPMLNCRLENGTDPVRVICDSSLRIPLESKIVQTASEIKTVVFYCEKKDIDNLLFNEKKQALISAGVELICAPKNEEESYGVDLAFVLNELGKLHYDSVLVEGGSEINFSLFKNHLVDYVYCFIAPKFFGGKDAKSPVGGKGIEQCSDCFKGSVKKISTFDEDILIEYEVK